MNEFDWPYSIVHRVITEGHTNQDTGAWIPGTESTAAITGNIEDITLRDLRQYPEGLVDAGDRRIFTAAKLSPGDRLQVTEPDGTVTEWIVKTLEESYQMFDESRAAYLLKRV
ncbi:MAG: hypothetical protein JXQ82_07740 [Methanomicrobiaceae archaeon]|nr:hypothetical protein [Methanomicrobiaceae archaeon]